MGKFTFKDYPADLVAAVRAEYQGGASQSEIGAKHGITKKVVYNIMRRNGIAARQGVNGSAQKGAVVQKRRRIRKADGLKYIPEYHVWRHMLYRCNNPNRLEYPRYGGRGIKVCQRWAESFFKFQEDMGPRPTPNHTIDRIDNDGNYEPGNCRWIPRAMQAQNTRRVRPVSTDRGEYFPSRSAAKVEIGADPLMVRRAIKFGRAYLGRRWADAPLLSQLRGAQQ